MLYTARIEIKQGKKHNTKDNISINRENNKSKGLKQLEKRLKTVETESMSAFCPRIKSNPGQQ